MARDLLHTAVDEVNAAMEEMPDTDASDRLTTLADRLHSQAEREAPPALGELDRIQHALHEIAADIDDDIVSERLEDAREQIFSFLETLEDRGMTQHGRNQPTESTDSD